MDKFRQAAVSWLLVFEDRHKLTLFFRIHFLKSLHQSGLAKCILTSYISFGVMASFSLRCWSAHVHFELLCCLWLGLPWLVDSSWRCQQPNLSTIKVFVDIIFFFKAVFLLKLQLYHSLSCIYCLTMALSASLSLMHMRSSRNRDQSWCNNGKAQTLMASWQQSANI